MKTRILCLLFALLLIPVLSACNKQGGDGDETTPGTNAATGAETDAETEDPYNVNTNLPEMDLKNQTIRIGTCNHAWVAGEISVEKYTGELVNDAVYTRNKNVESRLNCIIEEVVVGGDYYDIYNTLIHNVQANLHEFDLAMTPNYTGAIGVSRGIWTDLSTVSTVDLSQPYWSQLYTEQLSLGGSICLATGAISLTFYRLIYANLVNDRILASHPDAPDLIDVVNSGEWTIEYQTELCSEYYSDLNGNSERDEGDVFGLVLQVYNGCNPYLSSCEITMLEKDETDFYIYALDKTRMIDVVDQLTVWYTDDSTWALKGSNMNLFDEAANMFAGGHALMTTNMLRYIESSDILNMSDTYTILPIAKYSTDQDTYYSYTHDSFTSMGIPSTATSWDADTYGAVMETMAAYSYRGVTPAYYGRP